MRYGLIGWPLGHSISPQLHRRLAGVEYDLRPLPEAEFERFMRERDFSAVNVTIPYKRAGAALLRPIDPGGPALRQRQPADKGPGRHPDRR